MANGHLTPLYSEMLFGRWPVWQEHDVIAAGEELREVVRDLLPQAEADAEELERITQILVDFGALEPGDQTTGLADLLECLLPPRGEP